MILKKAYNAKKYEDKIYEEWERSGLFSPKIVRGKHPFTIMMPPPNATGTLHLGHAVMLALEDIMIRYHRMKGDPSLWLPGTDHASIATQNKVEKIIAEEGLTRHSLGREKFLKRVSEFVRKSQSTIRNQIRKMGSSCDWTREKYTLEPALSKAVRETFVRMYNDGLIYRGNRIVNWCPRCSSTLADDEIEYKEKDAKLYVFKYDEKFPFEIATTRPETKLGDSAVAVHPDDERYKKFIGKTFTIKFVGGHPRQIKVIADKNIDPNFGTGAIGVTPAHSEIDFEMAQKHGLPSINVIDEQGKIHKEHPVYGGMDVLEAREKITEYLGQKELLKDVSNIKHNLSVCYRCDTPVEPLISKQWFISVDKKFGKAKKSLKQIAIEVVKQGKIKILPQRFEKTYFHWMKNLHDWCISRQIWFGHQIPVWYCGCKELIVQTASPKKCPHCESKSLRQDPDTLDTWFSSGLWTFSTLGWPDKTKELEYFHPTSVLETGYDILFFWIARMIILTTYSLNEIPFKYVYLHGLVRTREGKKMSKSNPETCIDPLDMIEKYGADALRLSMIIGAGPGNDTRLYEEKIAGYRNFVNKIWNAARFAMMQENATTKISTKGRKKRSLKLALADKWILTRTQQLIKEITAGIENFQFSEAGTKIYDFTWNEYCCWYLEISKGEHKNLPVLNYVLETILALLHPFVPFVTEVLWKNLNKKNLLISQAWPKVQKKFIFAKDAQKMSVVVDAVSAIRNLRHESHIEPVKQIHAILVSKKWKKVLEEKREPVMRLTRVEKLDIVETAPKIHPCLTQYTQSGVEIILPLAELIDVNAERNRLVKEQENLQQYISLLETKLANKNFTSRAPKEIVKAEAAKLAVSKERLFKIDLQLKSLN